MVSALNVTARGMGSGSDRVLNEKWVKQGLNNLFTILNESQKICKESKEAWKERRESGGERRACHRRGGVAKYSTLLHAWAIVDGSRKMGHFTSLVKQEANSTQSTMQYPHGKGEVPDQISH